MKHTYLIALLATLHLYGHAQQVQFPYSSSTVTVDGILSSSEWADANTAWIKVNTTDSVRVQYQHDSMALYFAFAGKMESANALFPEILIDPQYQRGSSWVNGQWWFHVSATDCENNGGYGVYNNCAAMQPDWKGAPNFTQGAPMTDTVEISIPFSKVGIDIANTDTIGFAFVVTNTFNVFKLWPAPADKDVPSIWGTATLQKTNVGIKEAEAPAEITVYPNPVSDKLNISNVKLGSRIIMTDLTGKVLLSKIAANQQEEISFTKYTSGVYSIKIVSPQGFESYFKIMK